MTFGKYEAGRKDVHAFPENGKNKHELNKISKSDLPKT